ncbi:bcl-2-like protein 11 [Gasterosteus aculeatus]
MQHPSRPPGRPAGSCAQGGERRRGSGGGDPDSPRDPPSGGQCGRSTLRGPRRASSGYFSSEGGSLPNSPRPPTSDAATQTPSPAGQAMTNALRRMPEAREHGRTSRSFSTRRLIAAEDMQAETIGRELRRIGDDFDRILLLRGPAGGRLVLHHNPLPHIRQQPAVLLCAGLLLLLIGRMLYRPGGPSSQDPSEV